RTIGRIVVEEHYRVESEVELLCDRSQVFCLVFPVHAACSDVLFSQEHVRVVANDGERILGIVPTVERDNDAALMMVEYRLLERKVGIARRLERKLHALDAIFTGEPAPEGIVEVEHQAFLVGVHSYFAATAAAIPPACVMEIATGTRFPALKTSGAPSF